MRLITLLFTLLFWFNAVAVAPYGFKGQSQSTTLYSNVLQAPNNLVTNMGGINALVETGNKNILVNPSFEHSTFSTGWTSGAGSFSQNTSVEIDGLKAAQVVLSSQALAITQDSTLYASQFADGVQGLASIRVKTSLSGIKVCSRQAGTTSSTNCVDVQANGKWGLYKVPMILGATSNGISIASASTLTGTVYIDDAFVGAVDLKVDGAQITEWTSYTPTVSGFGTVSQLNALYRRVGGNLEVNIFFVTGTTASSTASVTLPSGLTISSRAYGAGSRFLVGQATRGVAASAGYTVLGTGGQTSFNFGAQSASDAGFTPANGSTIAGNTQNFTFQATVPIQEWTGSGATYSSTNADTDWASCGHTTSSFTGFGTVSAIETQCKRQGGDLLMRGKFTAGTPTAVEARLSLPLWNGVQLTSAGSSVIPSLQLAGLMSQAVSSTTYFYSSVLIETSLSYVTFGRQQSTVNALSKILGSNLTSNGDVLSFGQIRIPIEGWQNSNIIIGQFNGLESCLTTLDCSDTFSAKISAAGVVSDENVNWINGNCTNSSGLGTCTFNTSIFSVTPNCSVTYDGAGNTFAGRTASVRSASSTQILYITEAGSVVAAPVNIICQKQGADYVGKTAKAVASDQNVRVVGATGVDMQSVYFAGATLSTACSTSPCVIYRQVGSKITSVSRVAIGQYNLNGIDGTKYQCTGTAYNNAGTNRVAMLFDSSASSSTQATVSSQGVDTSYNSIICIGIP